MSTGNSPKVGEVSVEAMLTLMLVEEVEKVVIDMPVETKAVTFDRLREIMGKYRALAGITSRERQVLMPISLVDSMRESAVRYEDKSIAKQLKRLINDIESLRSIDDGWMTKKKIIRNLNVWIAKLEDMKDAASSEQN